MQIEHFAIDVPDAEAFKDWWCENLGLRRSPVNPGFLVDDTGKNCLEIYRTGETAAAPDYKAMNSMTLHVAFLADDVDAVVARLEKAGATTEQLVHKPGFDMAIVRDPWGVAIQFCHRANSIFADPK